MARSKGLSVYYMSIVYDNAHARDKALWHFSLRMNYDAGRRMGLVDLCLIICEKFASRFNSLMY